MPREEPDPEERTTPVGPGSESGTSTGDPRPGEAPPSAGTADDSSRRLLSGTAEENTGPLTPIDRYAPPLDPPLPDASRRLHDS